jgi:uncharacterized protein (TIGR02300 family)
MSSKAARGTKRTCQSCGARFYDLNRDPIICPICGAEYRLTGEAAQAHALRAAEALEQEEETDTAMGESAGVEVVSLEEADAENEDISDIEGDDLDDLEDDSNLKSDQDALMPDDDNDDDDVSGFISGPISETQDEDT